MLSELKPDVVLTDIRMPGMNGIELTKKIKALRPSTVVIMLTMYDSSMYMVEAIRAGAAGYVVKDSTPELLRHTIHAAVDGATLVRSELFRQAIQGLTRSPRLPEGHDAVVERFTARELDVVRLVTQGYPNGRIARDLSLAEATVKKYVQNIIGKLGASDRTHAAILAVRMGLGE